MYDSKQQQYGSQYLNRSHHPDQTYGFQIEPITKSDEYANTTNGGVQSQYAMTNGVQGQSVKSQYATTNGNGAYPPPVRTQYAANLVQYNNGVCTNGTPVYSRQQRPSALSHMLVETVECFDNMCTVM